MPTREDVVKCCENILVVLGDVLGGGYARVVASAEVESVEVRVLADHPLHLLVVPVLANVQIESRDTLDRVQRRQSGLQQARSVVGQHHQSRILHILFEREHVSMA